MQWIQTIDARPDRDCLCVGYYVGKRRYKLLEFWTANLHQGHIWCEPYQDEGRADEPDSWTVLEVRENNDD